jgi:hypothetical protein
MVHPLSNLHRQNKWRQQKVHISKSYFLNLCFRNIAKGAGVSSTVILKPRLLVFMIIKKTESAHRRVAVIRFYKSEWKFVQRVSYTRCSDQTSVWTHRSGKNLPVCSLSKRFGRTYITFSILGFPGFRPSYIQNRSHSFGKLICSVFRWRGRAST